MAIFRSYNDLVISFIEYLRLVQPEMDTKPGTVSRDLFIDAPSQQLADLYSQLRNISNLQSLFSSTGSNLTKLASNFGVSRRTGQSATGVAVLTTNNLSLDILIPRGSIIVANNGISFKVLNDTLMLASSSNVYRATATRLREELDLASITDQFAVEVTAEAITVGTSGNIGAYSLRTCSITGISNVTNLQSFAGGSSAESDDSFRTRILSVFAGSNTGTSLGYITAVEAISGVQDSIIIVPGDPLLIRDGTQTAYDNSGNLIVSDPGSGGKVDIYVLGRQLESQLDTFIYNDQSGKNDPIDTSNDFILGQRGQDSSLNVAQRRVTLISSDTLPYQPVDSIISVIGSSSGANFVEKYTDSNGQVSGNYELVKDSGNYSGSSFGFDKIRWISNQIELDGEEIVKGTFNGVDELDFSDVQQIRTITRDILVTNENSTTSTSNRKEIRLKHTPIRSVSRIVNLTTGERYIVENQNPDGVLGELNTTGKIFISGSTLPVGTDILQVDYIWVKSFDPVFDFDNLKDMNVTRTTQDSVDWSFGNLVRNEMATVADDGYGNLTVTLTHPVYKVISLNTYKTDISVVDNGILSVNDSVVNVVDIKRVSDGAELYNTDSMGGTLTGTSSIILPRDAIAEDGDLATVRFNYVDIFSPDGYTAGTFADNIITLPQDVALDGTEVLVNYIAGVSVLLPEINISTLPASRRDNVFIVEHEEIGNQPTSNIFDVNDNITSNIRKASSNLRVQVSSVASVGSITVLGTTIKKVTNALAVVTAGTGYSVDLQASILSDLDLSTLPSSIKVAKLYKLERVNLDSWNNIESVDNVYDIVNYKMKDNSFDVENSIKDESLNSTTIDIPETINNDAAQLNTGDIVRVTFYYADTNDSEVLYFSKSGEQITDNIFSSVSKVYVGHGFKNAVGALTGNIFIRNFNQPIDNTTYSVGYDYIAPKENERITVTFNHNKLINEITKSIEDVRPITADVLIKSALSKSIDVSVKIVLLPEYSNQEQTILQDATDAVTSFLSANSLGTTIDSSDIVNVLYTIQGVDRVRVLNFSYDDSGNLLSISAERNEYLNAGTVNIEVEER